MPDVVLTGCRSEPLAGYLKALGVLRLVAEQADREARGCWQGETFVLSSKLDAAGLVAFFAQQWRPTPVVAPWNGGSGFYPKDNREALDAIVASVSPRLAPYRDSIGAAAAFVAKRGWVERPEGNEKTTLVSSMRALLPDEALAWLDAAVVVGDERLMFPPLLGTGGNDGRLDFSNNFMQRVVEVMSGGEERLHAALFDASIAVKYQGAMGQYQPAASMRTNPWDFVLLIEGALMFAGAATRRLESTGPGTMSFPFHARAAGGSATVADSDEAESRDELWLPLWEAPTPHREVRWLLGEGRAKVGDADRARSAGNSLDFARAITRLGVDRGITGFTRVGFHVRNGLAYFATPLGRFSTGEVSSARLIDEIDRWFDRFRRATRAERAPASLRVIGRRLEDAVFEMAARGRSAEVLLAIADAEKALARSLDFVEEHRLSPAPRLSRAWVTAEDTAEWRLGAALGMRVGIRARMLPLDDRSRSFGRADDPGTVFADRALVDNLHALLLRDDREEVAPSRDTAEYSLCGLDDIAAFIDGGTDDPTIERWARAFTLVESVGGKSPSSDRGRYPPATFSLIALAHGRRLPDDDGTLPPASTALARASAGDARGATRAAIDRLRSRGLNFPIDQIYESPLRTRRIAAALAFPLTTDQRRKLLGIMFPGRSNDPRDERQKETDHVQL